MTYDYRLYGWRLRSERPLPFLRPDDGGPVTETADSDVIMVRFAPVPLPEGVVERSRPAIDVLADGRILLQTPDGVRLLVEAGRLVTVDTGPGGLTDAELHSYVSGPAASALCHQRGQPPLHAAVLAIDGVGVAVAGDSGVGKSTTARALIQRGARLLTDDQAVIDPASGLVHPGYPSLKLWTASAEVFGDAMEQDLRVRRDLAKFHMPQLHVFQSEPVPLAAVLVLRPEPGRTAPALEQLTRPEAAALLHRVIHRRESAAALDGGRAAFRWATALAQRTPVHLLRRPQDLGRLDALCTVIEGVVRAGGGQAG
ncbi:hypothetical protein [Oleisolibacter albus]|uniref:hypothetical protein n=1 Tax=Oleisolibacter albus TaxID=2171757 RepID=UPI000DF434E8|nr:hypothetical protein [Oleisolibacter albus]